MSLQRGLIDTELLTWCESTYDASTLATRTFTIWRPSDKNAIYYLGYDWPRTKAGRVGGRWCGAQIVRPPIGRAIKSFTPVSQIVDGFDKTRGAYDAVGICRPLQNSRPGAVGETRPAALAVAGTILLWRRWP